jgi:hypothetical protein
LLRLIQNQKRATIGETPSKLKTKFIKNPCQSDQIKMRQPKTKAKDANELIKNSGRKPTKQEKPSIRIFEGQASSRRSQRKRKGPNERKEKKLK